MPPCGRRHRLWMLHKAPIVLVTWVALVVSSMPALAAPAPDPAPLPKPDPKPANPAPPPPPPPPPSPRPAPAAPPVAPQPVAPSPPPPPPPPSAPAAAAVRPAAPRVVKRPARRAQEAKRPSTVRRPARRPASAVALASRPVGPSAPFTPVLGSLFLLALIFLAAAAVSPRLVPWPRVAAELDANRAQFAVAGVTLSLVVAVFFALTL
jgi:outer membrane biosynthesis protein TonB